MSRLEPALARRPSQGRIERLRLVPHPEESTLATGDDILSAYRRGRNERQGEIAPDPSGDWGKLQLIIVVWRKTVQAQSEELSY